jgi:MoxR-like ATPase
VRELDHLHREIAGIPEAVKKSVRYGASPRGGQALLLVARVRALLDGRFAAGPEDVAAAALPCLRHRILRNFEGEADAVSVDGIVREIAIAAGAKDRALFATA